MEFATEKPKNTKYDNICIHGKTSMRTMCVIVIRYFTVVLPYGQTEPYQDIQIKASQSKQITKHVDYTQGLLKLGKFPRRKFKPIDIRYVVRKTGIFQHIELILGTSWVIGQDIEGHFIFLLGSTNFVIQLQIHSCHTWEEWKAQEHVSHIHNHNHTTTTIRKVRILAKIIKIFCNEMQSPYRENEDEPDFPISIASKFMNLTWHILLSIERQTKYSRNTPVRDLLPLVFFRRATMTGRQTTRRDLVRNYSRNSCKDAAIQTVKLTEN